MQKFTVIITSLCLVLFLSAAVQFSGNPPSARTAAPGEQACNGCHGGTLNSGPGTASISIDNGRNDYTPGATYPVTVQISQSGISRFGFQITALDETNQPAGTIAVTQPVRTVLSNQGGRSYLSHTNGGTDVGSPGSNQWTFNWTAPGTNVGNITFYASMMASNRNGNTSGDVVYTRNAILSSIPFSLEKKELLAFVFPDGIRLTAELPTEHPYTRMILERSSDGSTFETVKQWNSVIGEKMLSHKDVPPSSGDFYYRISGFTSTNEKISARIIPVRFHFDGPTDFLTEPFYSESNLTFSLKGNLDRNRISLTDLNGKILAEKTLEAGQSRVNLQKDLVQGVYILKVNENLNRKIWVGY